MAALVVEGAEKGLVSPLLRTPAERHAERKTNPHNFGNQGTLTRLPFCLHNVSTMLLRLSNDSYSAMIVRDLLVPLEEAPVALQLALQTAHMGPGNEEGDRDGGKGGTETGTITRTRPRTKRPNRYRVLLLNDDYTPMEFVVLVLQDVFNKSREDAMRIMMHVHQKGVGECGVYPYEVAETKVTRVMDTARKNQHPLQCVMEKQ